jgi:hypothetical protein
MEHALIKSLLHKDFYGIMDDRALLQMALEELEELADVGYGSKTVLQALRERLAQPEPEAVDWQGVAADQAMTIAMMKMEQKRDWIGLDPEMMRNTSLEFNRGVRWAERYLKEKNHG